MNAPTELTDTLHSITSCLILGRGQLKCDGISAETIFRLSRETGRVNLNRPVGALVQSTTGSQSLPISGSNAGYTMFRGSVKGTGYPLHSPTSPPVRHRVPSHFKWSLLSHRLIPVDVRPRERVCGRFMAGIEGSNPADGMDVHLLCCVLCR